MKRKWLVAYDFSLQAEAALEMAVGLLRPSNELLLLYVHRPVSASFGAELAALSPAFKDVDTSMVASARARLDEVAEAVRREHPDLAVSTHISSGYPPEAIVAAARDADVDLIVIGSHGRRGLRRVFLGSVAERVVREADRCVTVVKRPRVGHLRGGATAPDPGPPPVDPARPS